MLESLFPEAFRYRRLDQEKRLPLADDEFKRAGVVLDEVAGFHSPGFTVDSVGKLHPLPEHRKGRFSVLRDVVMQHFDLFRREVGRKG